MAFWPGLVYKIIVVWGMRTYLLCAGIRIRKIGLDNIRHDRPAVYVSNHLSHMDIPAAVSGLDIRIFFMAKKSLLKIPFLGWAIPALRMFLVDRSTTEKAYRSIKNAAIRIREKGDNVLVYPEGGISIDGNLQPFKKGGFVIAVESGAPIVPIVLRGSNLLFDARKGECRPGVMELEILPEIDTTGYTQETKQELMEKVHAVFEEHVKKPVGQ